MPRRILALCALAATLTAGCGGGSDRSTSSSAKPAQAPAPRGCATVTEPKPKGEQKLRAPTARVPATAIVVLQTSCGDIEIRLAASRAPRTDASFAGLVERGFYDGLTFHRVVLGFVIQGGDPLGTGSGGPGYTVTEKPPASLRYTRGVVAMAKTQSDPPGASGSQFFVVTGADIGLPPDYALVGRVTKGMGAVRAIEAVPADAQGRPSRPVVIRKATLRAIEG